MGLSVPLVYGEIDQILAYISGDCLHVVIFEVKRPDTYPWRKVPAIPKKQAVNKAENQLIKYLGVLISILAGIPRSQLIFHTLACFPDTSLSELSSRLSSAPIAWEQM